VPMPMPVPMAVSMAVPVSGAAPPRRTKPEGAHWTTSLALGHRRGTVRT